MAQIPIVNIMADVALIARKAPNGTIIRAYNRAAREFCRQSRWLRDTLTGVTVADTKDYDLGADPDLEIIGIKAVSSAATTGNTQARALRVSMPTSWLPDQRSAPPQRYAYIPNARMSLDPTPNGVFDLVVTLVLQPTLGCNSIPEIMLARWDQTLQAGALSYLLEVGGQPWTDLNLAEAKRRMFQSGINAARADEQRDNQVGTFIARKRPFIVGRR